MYNSKLQISKALLIPPIIVVLGGITYAKSDIVFAPSFKRNHFEYLFTCFCLYKYYKAKQKARVVNIG